MAFSRGFALSVLLNGLLYGLVAGALDSAIMKELCKGHQLQAVAHPEGTGKYVFCSGDGATEHICRTGYCFSSKESQCVLTTGACATYPTISEVSNVDCKTEDFWMKTIPSKNCEKYYMCVEYDKSPITIDCPAQQHFSRYESKCMPMLEAYCMPPQLWCNNQPNGTRYAAEECFQYYECSNQERVLKECSRQKYFNNDLSDCVQGDCVNTDGTLNARKPDCTNQEGATLAHAKCNMYYVCHNNIGWEIQCPSGYYFEERSGKCVKDLANKCQ